MHPFESLGKVDWRGWLTLAWVGWFGFQYGQMVVERRADKLQAAAAAVTSSPSPSGEESKRSISPELSNSIHQPSPWRPGADRDRRPSVQ